MDPAFRTATADDAEAIVALVQSAYRGEVSKAGWTTEADILDGQRTDLAAVTDILADPQSLILLTAADMTACCHLQNQGYYAYFGMFAVDPGRQRHGVGKALLAEAERIAATHWGADEMHMTVITARQDLIAWYVRRGYTPTGKRTPFPYGDERFGIPLRDDLEFELLVKSLGA
ncbi:N-acetyltransferase [Rhizocola hellebori]|uniref:N-acetyltransferase n=1 Tax=Rhizocola hellebori TaxID=1392758 RepID=A0A8J3QE84_9ACTN|nr:GNAT family N-acetyltransferase [Rhizocola hellebori]GIH08000.1 N-acetyltransferase [Rhizocola hellebori]